jgi:hypothetical protein
MPEDIFVILLQYYLPQVNPQTPVFAKRYKPDFSTIELIILPFHERFSSISNNFIPISKAYPKY